MLPKQRWGSDLWMNIRRQSDTAMAANTDTWHEKQNFLTVDLRDAPPWNGLDLNAWSEPRKIYHHSLLFLVVMVVVVTANRSWSKISLFLSLSPHTHAERDWCLHVYVCMYVYISIWMVFPVPNSAQKDSWRSVIRHTRTQRVVDNLRRWNHRLDLGTEREATTLRNFPISLWILSLFHSGLWTLLGFCPEGDLFVHLTCRIVS
jgi:hypothetical protein